MCFYSDNYRDDDDEITPEDAKAFFDDYDKCSGFDPDDTILLFGCELSRTDLQLCSAFLSRFKTVNSACNALKASDALRNVIGYGKTTADPSTARWNAGYIPGQQVQFWPQAATAKAICLKPRHRHSIRQSGLVFWWRITRKPFRCAMSNRAASSSQRCHNEKPRTVHWSQNQILRALLQVRDSTDSVTASQDVLSGRYQGPGFHHCSGSLLVHTQAAVRGNRRAAGRSVD